MKWIAKSRGRDCFSTKFKSWCDMILAFTTTFTEENLMLQQWNAFRRRLKQSLAMTHMVERLDKFIIPPGNAAAVSGTLKAIWLPKKGGIS